MKRGLQTTILLFCGLLLILLACGKKGPPALSEESFSLTVKGLSSELDKGDLFLKGKIVSTSDETPDMEMVNGCRVYHALYPVNRPPCEGCPLDFTGIHLVRKDVTENLNGFLVTLPFKGKRGCHFFQVRLLSTQGAAGPLSDRAKLIVR